MNRILFSFLALVTVAQAQTAMLSPPTPRSPHDFDVQWTLGSGKYNIYRLSLTKDDIASSPFWAKNQDSPPLAPRKAIKFAQARLNEIAQPIAWNFAFLELQPIDQKGHWAYMVTFRRIDPPDALLSDHNGHDVVPVLMNGHVPKLKLIFISPDLLPPNLRPKTSSPRSLLQFQATSTPPPSQPSLQFQIPPTGH